MSEEYNHPIARFHVGQAIICVDAKWPALVASSNLQVPASGPVYHVRDIEPKPWGFGVLLTEISNPVMKLSSGRVAEPSFDEDRFMPA
ncbi:hypothetical protein [Hymenobacter crusticola]|uniref:Uncharacterized protein n=1 Tax=Hymenobacter crusticola TaxID=1770526 RepID=A0A243WA70_9BACT|nr:hypothetical protein [Hymenobacter crusticola]OUJ72352.1 hypothetical protein BXP70_19055 [Hymenobacter crusticola]